MRHLTLTFAILLLTGFTLAVAQIENEQKFKIEISYTVLPDPLTINYSIDNIRVLLYQTHYESKKDSYENYNKSTFKKFDRKKLITFLNKTDWTVIPSKLITASIDGYNFTIDLNFNNQSFHFDIDNTYHPTIDSLLTICNSIIPNKRKQNEYYLPYSEWGK